jgi:hypothetical protein
METQLIVDAGSAKFGVPVLNLPVETILEDHANSPTCWNPSAGYAA